MVSEQALADIVSTMPGYAYVISNYGSRSNPNDPDSLSLVQRSGDNKTFSPIATVAAQGNTTNTIAYHFTDQSPLTGNNYYRLKMLDTDGKCAFSKTVLLDFNSPTLRISPNPAHGTAKLIVSNTSQPYTIRIVDGSGQTIRQFRTSTGATTFPIDVSGLSNGVYTVQVTSATSTITQKLMIQQYIQTGPREGSVFLLFLPTHVTLHRLSQFRQQRQLVLHR